MRFIPVIGLVVMVATWIDSCQNAPPPQRDVMLEAIAAFEVALDAPLVRGKKVYEQYCSVCHGVEGKGDGFNAFNLNPRPRNFTESSFVARLDDRLLQETIANGGGGSGLSPLMPPWGRTLSERDVQSVAMYVKHLADTSTR